MASLNKPQSLGTERRSLGAIRTTTLSLLLAFLVGCGKRTPSDQVVEQAIRQVLTDKKVGLFINENYLRFPNKVLNYSILNHYSKRTDGENWYVYDVKGRIKAVDGPYDVRIQVGFVSRGQEWYFREVDF